MKRRLLQLTDLEKQFYNDMINIYTTAKKECNYNATRFLQMLNTKGGIQTAKELISKPGGTDGFTALYLHGRLDLSIEAHVLKPEYKSLFSEYERNICRKKLKDLRYNFEEK